MKVSIIITPKWNLGTEKIVTLDIDKETLSENFDIQEMEVEDLVLNEVLENIYYEWNLVEE